VDEIWYMPEVRARQDLLPPELRSAAAFADEHIASRNAQSASAAVSRVNVRAPLC
jgi:hypothetical protein